MPLKIKEAVKQLNGKRLYELRLRAERPITVNYGGKYLFLSAYGVVEKAEEALRCSYEDLSDCVYAAGKYSVYAVEEQIKRGFITAEHGERLGIAGEFVYEKGNPLTVRKIRSVCIRVPHEIIGAGAEIYKHCFQKELLNSLIISPPGIGKTTILRDLARLLSKNTLKNILVCDERGELSVGDLGDTSDILSFSDKERAFDVGIRAMRPDIIITDELAESDLNAVKRGMVSGVTVVASAHFSSFEKIGSSFRIFDRYAVLKGDSVGELQAIFDHQGQVLWQA